MFFSEFRALVRQTLFQVQVQDKQNRARVNGYLSALR
jgi:hypothetical protein